MLLQKILKLSTRVKIICLVFIIIFVIPITYSFFLAPAIRIYKHFNPLKTKMMLYRQQQHVNKKELYEPYYSYVPLTHISPYLINAVIFVEDGNFYNNNGFDLDALRNGFLVNMQKQRLALGGSTITMQLSKNLFLSPKKTYLRKYLEIILAKRMNSALSKSRILELYLNVIEWGDNIWGIQNASQYYFQKNAAELTLEESTILASIISRPLLYKAGEANSYFDDRKLPIRKHLQFLDTIASYNNQVYGPSLPTKDVYETTP